jgi:predicted GNAT family acetyltransferase
MTEKVNVDADDDIDVRDNPAAHRFEIWVGGEKKGFAAYRLEGDAYAFTHTEIADPAEGKGLGSRLVADALAQLRDREVAVLPYCPFVKAYLQRHPELVDVVPEADRARFDL